MLTDIDTVIARQPPRPDDFDPELLVLLARTEAALSRTRVSLLPHGFDLSHPGDLDWVSLMAGSARPV